MDNEKPATMQCPHDGTDLNITTKPGGEIVIQECPACGTHYTAEALAKLA